MGPFGFTRSCIRGDHALIAPESHVSCTVPGWTQSSLIILISPEIGSERRARFTQYLAVMERGGSAVPPPSRVERTVFVLEGTIDVAMDSGSEKLTPGGYAFLPAGSRYELRAAEPARLNIFEKPFVPLAGAAAPRMVMGNERDIAGAPFLGDEDALLKVLLPTDAPYDMAMNVFTFKPGAALPLVEVHVMEHGLLMLEGRGIYRLADQWYPVEAGDVIWMASYCPQWFAAVGKTQARYLYYKDVNRHPLPESC